MVGTWTGMGNRDDGVSVVEEMGLEGMFEMNRDQGSDLGWNGNPREC